MHFIVWPVTTRVCCSKMGKDCQASVKLAWSQNQFTFLVQMTRLKKSTKWQIWILPQFSSLKWRRHNQSKTLIFAHPGCHLPTHPNMVYSSFRTDQRLSWCWLRWWFESIQRWNMINLQWLHSRKQLKPTLGEDVLEISPHILRNDTCSN